MKCVIDCFKLVKGVGKSIGIYNLSATLVKNLVNYKLITDDACVRNVDIVIIGNKFNRVDFDIDGVDFLLEEKYDPLNKMHCLFWEMFGVSRAIKKIGADVVLFPRGFSSLSHKTDDIVIIHDMIPFFYHENFPNVFNKYENLYIMTRLKQSVEKSKRVITISEASKQQILKYCNVEAEKISIIHNGYNLIDSYAEKTNQKRPYICAITSTLPHKNAKAVFESYVKYCKLSKDPLDLIVVGVSNSMDTYVPENIRDKIICYKYIEDNFELHSIVANSEIFLFLSLAEGFGFPPIEAMQLKVPVICSNKSSLPEVVGDSAILVDPENYNAIAKSILELQINEQLRLELIKKGQENIKRFSWESRAKLYWDILLD